MDKQISLNAVRDLMLNNPNRDWERAFMNVRVYLREACPSSEDPRLRYQDLRHMEVTAESILTCAGPVEFSEMMGARGDQDVVIGNRIRFAGAQDEFLWYPQMDFMARQLTSESWEKMSGEVEPAYCPMVLNFYDSGRSYHGHGVYLMDQLEWSQWLGVMLRLNNDAMEQEPVVDVRWIGKALMQGQSFLRVTANSSHYIKVPTSINLDEHRDGGVAVAPF